MRRRRQPVVCQYQHRFKS